MAWDTRDIHLGTEVDKHRPGSDAPATLLSHNLGMCREVAQRAMQGVGELVSDAHPLTQRGGWWPGGSAVRSLGLKAIEGCKCVIKSLFTETNLHLLRGGSMLLGIFSHPRLP